MMQNKQNERVLRRLRIVQWAAWIDLILLVTLITAALSKQSNFVHVLGPLHGINFLLLVAIVATPALDGLWGWWFPIAVIFTAGAPGALIGEWIIKRRITSQSNGRDGGAVSPGERIETENMPPAPGMLVPKGNISDKREEHA